MKNNKTILRTDLRANSLNLMLVWLLLILSPLLIFLTLGEKLVEEQDVLHFKELKFDINSELTAFRQDLTHNSYLDFELEKCLKAWQQQRDNDQNLMELLSVVEKELELKPIFYMSYHAPTKKATAQISQKYKGKIGYMSNLIAREILEFKGQENGLVKGLQQKETPGYKRSASYLKKILKLNAELDINPNEAASFLSGIPELNRILICYLPLDSSSKTGYSGVLLGIKETDIKLQKIINFAKERKQHKKTTRSIVARPGQKVRINEIMYGEKEFSKDLETGEIYLEGFLSEQMILKLANPDGFYPENLDELRDNWPMLRVSVFPEHQLSPMKELFTHSRLPILIVFLVASILLLRINFFGLGSEFSLTVVLLLSLLFAALIPFSVLGVAIFYHQGHRATMDKIEMNLACRTAMEQLEQSILGFISNKETTIPIINGELLDDSLVSTISNFKQNIKHIHARTIVHNRMGENYSIVFNKGNKDEVLVYNDENFVVDENLKALEKQPVLAPWETDNRLDDAERDLLSLVLNVLNNTLKTVKMNEVLSATTFKAPFFATLKSYSIFFDALTRLNTVNDGPLNRIFTFMPSFNHDKNNIFHIRLESLTAFFFKIDQLLLEYMEKHPKALAYSDKGYTYKACLVPLSRADEKPTISAYLCHPSFNKKQIKEIVDTTTFTMSSAIIEDGEYVTMSRYLRKLNSVIVLKVAKLTTFSGAEEYKYVWGGIFYFSLVLLTILIYFWRVFINPIKKLIRGAQEVDKQNYQERITIQSNDEFGELTQAFNRMTQGLMVKDLMSSYVATDVLDEIGKAEETLLPGGEKINVSIVFCSIEGFEEARKNLDEENFNNLLNDFIDLVDSVSSKHNGQIDKLIGDTLMIVFRQREKNADRFVLNCAKATLELQESFLKLGHKGLRLIFGIATGEVISGKIGSYTGKLDFTVIGNSANLASRLKGEAHQAVNTGILLCPQTIRQLRGAAVVNFIKRVSIKGRSRAFSLYELTGLRK